MKKSIAILLATALMLVLFAGCGTSKAPTATATSPAPETSTAAAPTGTASGEWDFSKDKQFDLTFSLYLPEGNSSYQWITPLCDEIKAATDGTVTIKVYPGGTLAAGDETADAIKNGVADMGLWPTAYALGTFPLSYMLEYPGIHYASAKAASYAFTEWLEKLNPAEVQDYKLLFSYCSGPGIFLTANKPIRTVADFAGLQIRANSTNAPAVKAYGGTPVTLGVGEVYEAMRTGVIDGYCGLTESLMSFKLQEVTKYATLNPNFNCAFMVLMNQEKYNAMSDGQKAAVDKVAKEIYEKHACCYLERDWAQKALDTLKGANVEIINLDDSEVAKMGDLTKDLLTTYAADLDSKGIKGTEALELLRQLAEKYNAQYPTND